jgi:hypothetical protein
VGGGLVQASASSASIVACRVVLAQEIAGVHARDLVSPKERTGPSARLLMLIRGARSTMSMAMHPAL